MKIQSALKELLELSAMKIESLLPALLAFRETLHAHPELSWEEYETTRRIEEFLKAHDVGGFQRNLETGGMVDLTFSPGEPSILLRADIDALPIQDEKSVSYRSTIGGVCHACAHDVHTTIVAGTLIVLNQLKPELRHNLRGVFQPAEEPIPSGAPRMIEAGALENVALALGMHIEPRLPLHTIGLADGWVNLQSIRLDLTLLGEGGHSARPSEAVDLIWIASRIVQDSYQKIYRQIDLRTSPMILTFTEIEAAQGYNVIPSRLRLTGTLRLAEAAKKDQFLILFQDYLERLQAETGCKIEWTRREGAPAIYNNPALIARLKQGMAAMDASYLVNDDFRTPGADDFSWYAEAVPGAMVRFGVREGDTHPGLHEGTFDVPAEVIRLGVEFFTRQIIQLGVS